jgi:hypothetical protein
LGGLILDNIIVFLCRTVVRLVREHRSGGWPVVEGRAGSADFAPFGLLGFSVWHIPLGALIEQALSIMKNSRVAKAATLTL